MIEHRWKPWVEYGNRQRQCEWCGLYEWWQYPVYGLGPMILFGAQQEGTYYDDPGCIFSINREPRISSHKS